MNSTIHNHRKRMEACLSGKKPDRVPVALWRHFPVDDQSPGTLAKATISFQKQFDFDLIKVSPSSSFCLKDWGIKDQWNGATEGTRVYTDRVIHNPEDWKKLPLIDPLKGHLGNQLSCLQILSKEFSPNTPIIQTIFSPMSQAKNLIGGENLLAHMRQFPDALHEGLKIITSITIQFIEEAVKTGIDGIFYAIQHAQYRLLSREEFEKFCKPYDLQVLQATQKLWLNMIHLHGEKVMFDEVARMPAQIINWHDRHTPPSLSEGKKLFSGLVCGGLKRQETMVLGNADQVRKEAEQAIRETDGTRFILGTGCVLPVIAPYGNIMAAREIVG